MEVVYSGLGSNLAEPAEQLRQAIEALGQLPSSPGLTVSALYSSESLSPGQPRYTTAVARLETSLAPPALLDASQATVNDQVCGRAHRWGPRTSDVCQLALRRTPVGLDGRSVPRRVLQQCGEPAQPNTGESSIQLTASCSVQANAPLKPTVNGKLSAVNMDKQQVEQTMTGGIVSTPVQ